MTLVLVGASHHDVPLDEIARLSAAGDRLARQIVSDSADVAGAFVLSTCNRFEVYLDLRRFHDPVEATTQLIAQSAQLPIDYVADAMRVVVGTSVAQHLFSVDAGLESMVVGEDEIAGQVRDALARAQREGTTSPTIERLLQRALATSKAVTSMTGLGAAGRSIVTVGLDVAEDRHGSLEGQRALVLGTGSYARVVSAALARRGCIEIGVHSTSGRASGFAATHDLTPVSHEHLEKAVRSAGVVAACSGSNLPVLDRALLARARTGAHATLPILDLALVPDVASDARDLPEVDVIDLGVIHAHAPREHSAAILEAQNIVLDAVGQFERDESGRTADGAVVAMRSHVMAIIDDELQRIRGRVDVETADEVARSLNRVSNALLHTPSIQAHELARTGNIADYHDAVRTLFGIDIDARTGD